MLFLNNKRQTQSRRRALFLQARNGASRPDGPYRPRRLPRLTRKPGLGKYVMAAFLLLLVFSFAHVWRASAVIRVCSRLDALRSRRQDLQERLKAQQLIFQEVTLYSRIEPLARERLGMYPSPTKPVVIAPLREQFDAVQNATHRQSVSKRE